MVRRPELALLAFFGLVACGQPVKLYTEDEISDIASSEAAQQIEPLEARITALERAQKGLQDQIDTTRNLALALNKAHDGLVKTFNKNVEIDNRKTIAAMTARGDCGMEWRQSPSGQQFLANRACTEKDLK